MKKLYVLGLILCLTACGTVFNGSSQDVKFDSNVNGVTIYVNGMRACKTPCVYPLERQSATLVVAAKKRGYQEQQTIVKSQLSGVAVLNLTFWPSWLTDVATGGMWKYSRDGIYIEMERENKKYSSIKDENNGKEVRRFSLFNYGNLKAEAVSHSSGEYIKTLSSLSGKNENYLIEEINKSTSEVNLAHVLTNIK